MAEERKDSFAETVDTAASTAHTVKGAIKAGKAISGAAKGAAAGGPYSKHPESSKLRDCKASAHIPEWRKLEEQAQPKPAAAPSPAPKPQGTAPKKPAKRKPKAVGTPAGTKQAAPAPSTEAPDGIITTDKDSILS